MTNLAAFYTGLEEQIIRQKWVAEFASALHDDGNNAYVNFITDESEIRGHSSYPEATWRRLASIKKQYDPTNLFRRNQNIPPER
jgi:FAD/FMN-containing dehydrogenase